MTGKLTLTCAHCGKDSVLSLPAATPTLSPTVRKKSPLCACGHDAHSGRCGYGKGTAFWPDGCPCPGMHSKRKKNAYGDGDAARPSQLNGASEMGKGERLVLTAIAQQGPVMRDALTVLTGYKRATRDAYLFRLARRQYTTEALDGFAATPMGLTALGSFERLPTGSALLEHWKDKLPEGESTVLAFVASRSPRPVSREDVSHMTGYKRSTRDAYIYRLIKRRLVHAVEDGVIADASLFD